MKPAEQLTLLPEASHSCASHSVSPGSDAARRMTVTSGRKWLALLANVGPAGCSVRTLLGSSAWRSTIVSLTWKASVTKRGRLLFRLAASAPGIDESASGSLLPTPNVQSLNNRAEYPTAGGDGLATAVKRSMGVLLPTPRTEGFDAGAHRGKPDSLHSYVKMLPTPTVNDSKNDGSPSQHRRNSVALNTMVKMLPTPRASPNENRQTKPMPSQLAGKHGRSLAAEIGGSLNPAFVEFLMGYPQGWTDVPRDSKPSATRSSPRSPT